MILEVLRDGASPIVDRAVDAAEPKTRADILRRRGLAIELSQPRRRGGRDAIAQAECARAADIRCDLQMHSDWSDGGQTLEEIIETGIARGYTHSAVTDHSYGLPIAGGLSMARVEQQHREIDALNAKYQGKFRLLKGIEANIRADGSVDMTYAELARMEIVVAAPHSALRSSADQTARMLGAVQTPRVHILGHPRGRMYGSRPGVTAEWERVFDAAARLGVAIELDGDPSRQDLDYDLARRAIASGCLFAIDSDAHATDQWWYAETALAHATACRRAAGPRDQLLAVIPLAGLGRASHARRVDPSSNRAGVRKPPGRNRLIMMAFGHLGHWGVVSDALRHRPCHLDRRKHGMLARQRSRGRAVAHGSYAPSPKPPSRTSAAYPGRWTSCSPAAMSRSSSATISKRSTRVAWAARRSAPSSIKEGEVVWLQEYIRYRVNGCDHATAMSRVLTQIDGGAAGGICSAPPEGVVNFPPRNDVFDARRDSSRPSTSR